MNRFGLENKAGQTERAVPLGQIILPTDIRLSEKQDQLIWSRLGADGIRPGPDLLTAFIRLAEASPQAILSFAKQRGILGLPPAKTAKMVVRKNILETSEPIGDWRRIAAKAAAVLRIAADLREGSVTDAVRWDHNWSSFGICPPDIKDSGTAQDHLAGYLSHWLKHAGVSFALQAKDAGGFTLELGYGFPPGLFAAVGMQLVTSVGSSSGISICCGCGLPYIIPPGEKKPRKNARNYCPSCRQRKVPVRDAVRDHRERRRKGGH